MFLAYIIIICFGVTVEIYYIFYITNNIVSGLQEKKLWIFLHVRFFN